MKQSFHYCGRGHDGQWPEGPLPSCSVVIPYFEEPHLLKLVLEGLRAQDLPSDSFEVIVADDGSRPELAPSTSGDYPFAVHVVSHNRQGARRALVRNLGVTQASGDVLCFLDGDMLPDPRFVRSHLRHHVDIDYALVVGDRLHVDPTGLEPELVAESLATTRSVRPLAAGRRVAEPRWRRALIDETAGLTVPNARGWRVAGGGNLSLTRTLFTEVGGFSSAFTGWGGEDLEFAYRAEQHGGLFEWEPSAFALHLGMQGTPSFAEVHQQRLNRRLVATMVADRELRAEFPWRVWSVPQMAIQIAGEWDSAGELADCVDALLLAQEDVAIAVDAGTCGSSDMLRNMYADEPRASFGGDQHSRPPSPWRAPITGWVRKSVSPSAIRAALNILDARSADHVVAAEIHAGNDCLARLEVAALRARMERCATEDELSALLTGPAHTVHLADQKYEWQSSRTGNASQDADLALQALRNAFWGLSPWARRLLLRAVTAWSTLRFALRRRPHGEGASSAAER